MFNPSCVASRRTRLLGLRRQKLTHGAVSLADGDLGHGPCAGVGVGDGDPATRMPGGDPRGTLGRHLIGPPRDLTRLRIEAFGIAVRPASHGYRRYVARRVEASGGQYPAELDRLVRDGNRSLR